MYFVAGNLSVYRNVFDKWCLIVAQRKTSKRLATSSCQSVLVKVEAPLPNIVVEHRSTFDGHNPRGSTSKRWTQPERAP
jgi:hypothetical protein